MRKHCTPWQPCKIFQERGDAPCPYSNRRPRLTEASPHDTLWGIGLGACDPRASSPDSWCGQNLLGQALEHVREILRRDITAPLSNSAPETPVPRDDTGDTVFEVEPITHLRLDTDPHSANTHMVALSAFTYSVPDDHAPEVRLAQKPRIDAPLIPEQGSDLNGSVVTMDDATFITLLSLHSGVSTTSRLPATPSWTQDPLNTSFIEELSTKWSPRALLTRLPSDPPRLERGVVSDPDSCSAPTDRLEWPSSSTATAHRPRPLQVGCTLYPTRLCDAPSYSATIVGCVSIPAPIKHSRRNKTAASLVNSPSHAVMIISATPLPISAIVRPQTPLTTSSTTAQVFPSSTPHSLFR